MGIAGQYSSTLRGLDDDDDDDDDDGGDGGPWIRTTSNPWTTATGQFPGHMACFRCSRSFRPPPNAADGTPNTNSPTTVDRGTVPWA
jgi:hypothetical protein